MTSSFILNGFTLIGALLVCGALNVLTEEFEEHGYYGDQHDHPEGADTYAFDHEVFLGSRELANEFLTMDPDQAKDRLLIIAQEIDDNGDGLVSRNELVQTIAKNFLSLDEEEAAERLQEVDENKDLFVDWAEYVKDTYQTSVSQLDELLANESVQADPHVKSTVRTYISDRIRFNLADQDKDGKLSLVEFTAFTHPYDFEHMLPSEIQQTIESYDTNEDGVISMQEFLRDDASGSPGGGEWRKAEEDRFMTDLDLNKDGVLDAEEVKKWIAPSLQTSSEDEADHLIQMIDTDGDGQLSQGEMLEAYNVLVGSNEGDWDETGDHDEL